MLKQDRRDEEIEALVDEMERADVALAVYLHYAVRVDNPVRDLLETRAAILRWCGDALVARCFDDEAVRATAAAVHAMTLPEFVDYVRALRYLGRRYLVRTRGVA
jgi:hypothetical protein